MRDATRGGVATVLNEFAAASRRRHRDRRDAHADARARCKGFCEILGLDPLYLANEGKIVAVVPAERGARPRWRPCARHPLGARRRVIGRVARAASPAVSSCAPCFGGRRIVDMLVGEQLPRIC